MMVNVREAKLTGLEEKNCIKIPTFEVFGDKFDYDLQVKIKGIFSIIKFFYSGKSQDKIDCCKTRSIL